MSTQFFTVSVAYFRGVARCVKQTEPGHFSLPLVCDSANRSWNLSGAILQPLSGLAAISARVETARSAPSEAILNYERAARNAYGDAKSALVTRRASRDTLRAAQTRVEAQNHAKALIALRYKQGVSSLLDVVDAERNRLAAERDRVNALRDRLTALGGLERGGCDQIDEKRWRHNLCIVVYGCCREQPHAIRSMINP